MTELAAGSKAPDFSLPDEAGHTVRLSDFKGKTVVLYFYPADFTPGCTTEACDFRDAAKDFGKRDVVVLGVSPDTVESHAKFAKELKLGFRLLADPDRKVLEKYGVWGDKVLYGRTITGVLRSTFVIGPDGRIVEAMRNVRAKGHVERVLERLEAESP